MMQNPIGAMADYLMPRSRHSAQRPVVIIEQNQSNLSHLIDLYLGLADIILVPNAYVGLRMINLFKSEHVEVLAVEGLFGYGTSQQEEHTVQSMVI